WTPWRRRWPREPLRPALPAARVVVVLRRVPPPRPPAPGRGPGRVPPPRARRLPQGGGGLVRGVGGPGPGLPGRLPPLHGAPLSARPAAHRPPRLRRLAARAPRLPGVPGRLHRGVLALRGQHLRVRGGAELLRR